MMEKQELYIYDFFGPLGEALGCFSGFIDAFHDPFAGDKDVIGLGLLACENMQCMLDRIRKRVSAEIGEIKIGWRTDKYAFFEKCDVGRVFFQPVNGGTILCPPDGDRSGESCFYPYFYKDEEGRDCVADSIFGVLKRMLISLEGFVDVVKENSGEEAPITKLVRLAYENVESALFTVADAIDEEVGNIVMHWQDEKCMYQNPATIKALTFCPCDKEMAMVEQDELHVDDIFSTLGNSLDCFMGFIDACMSSWGEKTCSLALCRLACENTQRMFFRTWKEVCEAIGKIEIGWRGDKHAFFDKGDVGRIFFRPVNGGKTLCPLEDKEAGAFPYRLYKDEEGRDCVADNIFGVLESALPDLMGFIEVVEEKFGEETPITKLVRLAYKNIEQTLSTISDTIDKEVGSIVMHWQDEGYMSQAPRMIKGVSFVPVQPAA